MSRPAPDGPGDGSVDADDGTFDYAVYSIEQDYGDLLGIEAVSHACIQNWTAAELGQQPQVGESGDSGPGEILDYTMPTRTPFTVQPRLRGVYYKDNDGAARKQLDKIFHTAKAGATGTADYFKGTIMSGIFGTDPKWLGWAADQQLQALTHLHGQLTDDFATVASTAGHPRAGLGPLMDDHFKGSTAESFRAWYQKVDDVVNELVDYAGVAQLAAAGTANVLTVAKQSMARSGTTAQKAFSDSVDAWRNDPASFPFPPGTAEKAWKEFTGLVSKVEEYASLVPGPIGKASDAAQTGQKIIGAASNLFGLGEPHDVKSAARAEDLYTNFSTTLWNLWDDTSGALAKLGQKTTPKKNEVTSRPQLVLPTEKPHLHYT